MKAPPVTIDNYTGHREYHRIVRAVREILDVCDEVAPLDVLERLDLLRNHEVQAWYRGSVPWLECALRCSHNMVNRVLRILRMHVHDLNLAPAIVPYVQCEGRHAGRRLWFTRGRQAPIEDCYRRHYVVLGKRNQCRRGPHPLTKARRPAARLERAHRGLPPDPIPLKEQRKKQRKMKGRRRRRAAERTISESVEQTYGLDERDSSDRPRGRMPNPPPPPGPAELKAFDDELHDLLSDCDRDPDLFD